MPSHYNDPMDQGQAVETEEERLRRQKAEAKAKSHEEYLRQQIDQDPFASNPYPVQYGSQEEYLTHQKALDPFAFPDQDPFAQQSGQVDRQLKTQIQDEMNLSVQELRSAQNAGDPDRIRSALDLFKFHKDRFDFIMNPTQ